MKILFDGCDFSSRTGPNTFAKRLAKALALRGNTIADPNDYDVAICFINPSPQFDTRRPFIQRLDGIWFKPEEFTVRNVGIKKAYDVASAVVFQSNFNKTQITGWWGNPKLSAVIGNAIDPIEVSSAIEHLNGTDSLNLDVVKKEFDTIFVCSANWHPQKRLRSNIELFTNLKRSSHPNSCLIILGNNVTSNDIEYVPKVIRNSVFYAGSLQHEHCLQVYAQSDYMIHLAWLDHNPNVVVESLSCGCPVVCSFDGGTKELVLDCGTIIHEVNPYDYTLRNYDDPPQIDVRNITLNEISDESKISAINRLDIHEAAESYETLLRSII